MQDETLRKAVGARLKALRKQENWAQKGLAAQVDTRFQQPNNCENGPNIPPTEIMVKRTDVLGVTVDFLLPGNPPEDSPLANSRLLRCFKVLEAPTSDDQKTDIKVIDAMIAKARMAAPLVPVDASA